MSCATQLSLLQCTRSCFLLKVAIHLSVWEKNCFLHPNHFYNSSSIFFSVSNAIIKVITYCSYASFYIFHGRIFEILLWHGCSRGRAGCRHYSVKVSNSNKFLFNSNAPRSNSDDVFMSSAVLDSRQDGIKLRMLVKFSHEHLALSISLTFDLIN